MISRSRQRGKNPTSRTLNFGESRFPGSSQRGCQLRFCVSISNYHNNNKHLMSGHRGNKYSWKLLLSDVFIFLHCSLAQRDFGGKQFPVTSKQSMRPGTVEKKFPAIKESDCKDISDYLKTSFDHYPNRHKASIYCLPDSCLDCE